MVVGFIDDYRVRFGVEPICRVLSGHGVQVAPSGYYAFKARTPSKRALSDAYVWERIEALQADKTKGRGVAGYRKMWHLLKRDGVEAPRCQVARLTRARGMQGVVRGRKFVTTTSDSSAPRPPDLVQRDFTATRTGGQGPHPGRLEGLHHQPGHPDPGVRDRGLPPAVAGREVLPDVQVGPEGPAGLPPPEGLDRSPPHHRVRRPRRRPMFESTTGASIKALVKTLRRHRTIDIQAGDTIVTAENPLPDDAQAWLDAIHQARRRH